MCSVIIIPFFFPRPRALFYRNNNAKPYFYWIHFAWELVYGLQRVKPEFSSGYPGHTKLHRYGDNPSLHVS